MLTYITKMKVYGCVLLIYQIKHYEYPIYVHTEQSLGILWKNIAGAEGGRPEVGVGQSADSNM